MFGLTFHPYGLIIGIALVVSWELLHRICENYQISFTKIQKRVIAVLVGGLIVARLWHGVTDWELHAQHPIMILYIWNGGLSIIGGIIGGVLVIAGITFFQKKPTRAKKLVSLLVFTDLLAHVLPIGQLIGRLGNYFNQELYGLPTQLPWGLYIDTEHRLSEVVTYTHFHPLFLYEMVLNCCITIFIWRKKWQLGSGQVTGWYLVLYGLGRWLLDFLRIDRGDYVWLGLSLNQFILLLFVTFGLILLGRGNYHEKSAKIGR